MSDFAPQATRIYQPYSDEIPLELLRGDDPNDEQYPQSAKMRIAKFDGEVVGVYVIEPVDPLRYRLLKLVVDRGFRGHGLGRWLLGHAIGLAESKGAREILVTGQTSRRFLAPIGFEEDGPNLKLTLTPE
jgi:GNAT superfamily N-acetyltransferase